MLAYIEAIASALTALVALGGLIASVVTARQAVADRKAAEERSEKASVETRNVTLALARSELREKLAEARADLTKHTSSLNLTTMMKEPFAFQAEERRLRALVESRVAALADLDT